MPDDYRRPSHRTHSFRGTQGGWQDREILWPKAFGASSFSSHLQRPHLDFCGVINMLFSVRTNRSLEHIWVWWLRTPRRVHEGEVRSVRCVCVPRGLPLCLLGLSAARFDNPCCWCNLLPGQLWEVEKSFLSLALITVAYVLHIGWVSYYYREKTYQNRPL